MDKQVIITIGREFGSGGHFIAQKLAERLGIKLYDKTLLEEVGYQKEDIRKYDEKRRNHLLSRKVGEHSNSIEEMLAHSIFSFIRNMADKGESFVVVGRCSEFILRDNPNTLRFFILGDIDEKCKRIMEIYNLSEKKALDMMRKMDKQRKLYHNYYSDIKWGDSRGYDLCINSSKIGIDKTVDIIIEILAAVQNN